MPRLLFLSLLAAALTLGVVACGDDDDTADTGSPSPSGATPTVTIGDGRTSPPTASVTDAPDDGDDKTAPPTNGDGNGDDTAAPTAPGPTPSAPPTATVGTPAPQAESSIVAEYQGQLIENITCEYNPNTAQILCGDDGIYAPDPPLVGQDVICQLWIVSDIPVLINCTSVEPRQNVFYDIAE